MRPLPHVPDWPRLTSGKKIQGLCPHPPLRFPRQSAARRPAATVLRRSPRSSTASRIGNLDRSGGAPAVALSQVRGTDGRRRTIHRRTTPNSVLHPSWPRLHEITRPHTARSRVSVPLADVCLPYPQTSSSCPRLGSLRPSARLCTRCAGCYSSSPDDSRELLHSWLAPFNLHKSRVRRASGFLLTAFSNATPHTFFQPSALPASRLKKH